MGREAWQAMVHGVAESQTRLKRLSRHQVEGLASVLRTKGLFRGLRAEQ